MITQSLARSAVVATVLVALGAGLASSQERGQERAQDAPEPARVERVFVPEEAFDEVVERHPRGVVVRDAELDELLRRAGLRPAVGPTPAPPPVAAVIRHVRVSGSVKDDVGTITCEAEVSVLVPDAALLLPLRGVGLRRVTVDGAPARVLPDAQGVRVLIGGGTPDAPATRRITWELGVRIEPGEERGAGVLTLQVPPTASGRLDLLVPGDVEVVLPALAPPGSPVGQQSAANQQVQQQAQQQGQQLRNRAPAEDSAFISKGCIAWEKGVEGASTRLEGAFGGGASAGASQLVLSWRPRRSVLEVTPYVVADERSVFCVRQGVVTLEATAALDVFRAGRDRFALDLPPGFVVRSLVVENEEVTHVQRGDRVEVTLGAPRTGRFSVRLRAELTTGGIGGSPQANHTGGERQTLALQPLGFPDANRASGLVGLAQGEGTVVAFDDVQGLERADALDLGGGATQTQGDVLLRVYRRTPGAGRLAISAAPQAPRVDLVMRTVIGLGEREVRALSIFQFRVERGRVFRVTADVPGFAIETVQVRMVQGNRAVEPVHQLTQDGGRVLVELQEALRGGQELFLNVQAVREEPTGLAGRAFDVPRVTGTPATSFRGHIGFAPDEAYRLTGSDLVGLTAIPAAELPRAGLDVSGLVLGYRIDAPEYAGKVHPTQRETRVSTQLTTQHRVQERVVDTDALLEVQVDGAPIASLELLLPAGIGRLARLEAPSLKDDRELLGVAADGRERWKLMFDERKKGLVPVRVRFSTTLPGGSEGASGAAAGSSVDLPRVSVAGAFRERGTVAVFSSDATELMAQPQGLRAIEVTDVAPLADSAVSGRPLFAYTHTGADHRLGISVKRRDAAAVLSAVVQKVDLRTSAAPDGLSRHVVTFHVRHLETQFFSLRLPAGAQLWSVVVGDQGVKPADGKNGLKIIPMPTGALNEVDQLTVTYTLKGQPWGVTTRADLVAPELLVQGDRAIPVLHTSWTIALPDDYRVLEFEGNLRGQTAATVRPMTLGLWSGAQDMSLALALVVLALGVGASERARGWLLGHLGRSGSTTRGLGRGLGQGLLALVGARRVQLGCAALVVLGFVGFCLLSSTLGRGGAGGGRYAPYAEQARYKATAEDSIHEPPAAVTAAPAPWGGQGAGGGGDYDADAAAMPTPSAAPTTDGAYDHAPQMESAPADESDRKEHEERAKDQTEERTRGRRDAPGAVPPLRQPASPPPAPPAPKPRPQAQGVVSDALGEADAERNEDREAKAEMPAEPEPVETPPGLLRRAEPPPPPGRLAPGKDGPTDAPAGPEGGRPGAKEKGGAAAEDPTILMATLGGEGLASNKEAGVVAGFGPELGRVGLRSLVLALPNVGRLATFERPGGQGQLVVQVVQRDALTLGAGALAAIGLAFGLLLPIRGRASYLGLLLVTGAVLTALPYVLQDVRFTTLLNALFLGVLLAAPVHVVRGVASLAAGAREAVRVGAPRDEALRALAILDGVLATLCLTAALVIASADGHGAAAGVAVFGLTGVAMLVACLGLSAGTRWALVPTLVVGLGQALLGTLALQEALRPSAPGLAVVLSGAHVLLFGVAALGALASLLSGGGASASGMGGRATGAAAGRAATVLLGGLLLLGGATPARAQQPEPAAGQGPRVPRVFVPYDPANPDFERGDVYVPEDVYLDLWRRAYPERVSVPPLAPPAACALGQVTYEGTIGAAGDLTLQAQVVVDVLATGPQRCALGLAGAGLKDSKVQGGKPNGRVRVAPAGGFELVADGPATYVVTLDLVVPSREGGYVFATVPAASATLRVRSVVKDRRVVVGGARAQVEALGSDGTLTVDASLGDAARVHLTLPGREVLSTGGASEAAATTKAVVWVRRGRAVLLAQTVFDITGAGREGFLFDVPAGFEVTSVQTEGLRAWRIDERGRLEIALRRPTGPRAAVVVSGEQPLPPGTSRFKAPQVVPQGVNREAGVLGLCVEDGLRARPVDPSMRQVAANQVQSLAQTLHAGSVERAYEFARRPAELQLELVQEPAELEADADVRAIVHGDRVVMHADIGYQVRRGKVHEVVVAVPAGFDLVQPPGGLDVREASTVGEENGVRTLRFGLATGLTGPGRLTLVLERRLDLVATGGAVPFPDVRTPGVSTETTSVTIAVAEGLRLRPKQEPTGLSARDVRAATRGGDAPAGTEWALAYQRQNGRVPGLGSGVLTVTRPTPRVTGSWTLHARVERDVVRYTMRAVYRIADAGASQFHLLLPADVIDRVSVDAANQREVRSAPAPDAAGMGRLTVELQSPAEEAYELGATWEQVLVPGQPFTVPQVALADVERQARRFVLVETAPDVPDKLEEVGLDGPIEKARASEAPVLPGPASDFAHAYRVGGSGGAATEGTPWAVRFKLAPREVRLPPAARVPWAEITSVFTTEGVVRHRARYRVHNLRLQFLSLKLPEQAEVWSVFVAGAPKRLHHEDGLTLIPLPKGTDADLSFDVELIYATPLPGAFGFGQSLAPMGPILSTGELQVERTQWTIHVPDEYSASGFAGMKEAAVGTSKVQALVEDVNELKKLVDLAENASGSTKLVAENNLQLQMRRVEQQLRSCEVVADETTALDRDLLKKSRADVGQLASTLEQRQQQQTQHWQEQQQQGAAPSQQGQVLVDGKNFERLDSGWYSNTEATGGNAKTRWSGLKQDEAAGPGRPAADGDSWTLSIPEGQTLSLSNAEVFSGRYNEVEDVEQQRAQNLSTGKRRLLDNRGYEQALGESQQRQEEAEKLVEQTAQLRGAQQVLDPAASGGLKTVNSSQTLLREGDKANEGTLDYGSLEELENTRLVDGVLGSGTRQGYLFGAGRTEGLLSIQVPFVTPGRAYHFASDTPTPPSLTFTVYPEGTGEQARRAGRGLVLLVLLAGVIRLGLLGRNAGRGALQALALGVAAGLVGASFTHVVGAALALGVGLWAIHHGALFKPAPAAGAGAGPAGGASGSPAAGAPHAPGA